MEEVKSRAASARRGVEVIEKVEEVKSRGVDRRIWERPRKGNGIVFSCAKCYSLDSACPFRCARVFSLVFVEIFTERDSAATHDNEIE